MYTGNIIDKDIDKGTIVIRTPKGDFYTRLALNTADIHAHLMNTLRGEVQLMYMQEYGKASLYMLYSTQLLIGACVLGFRVLPNTSY